MAAINLELTKLTCVEGCKAHLPSPQCKTHACQCSISRRFPPVSNNCLMNLNDRFIKRPCKPKQSIYDEIESSKLEEPCHSHSSDGKTVLSIDFGSEMSVSKQQKQRLEVWSNNKWSANPWVISGELDTSRRLFKTRSLKSKLKVVNESLEKEEIPVKTIHRNSWRQKLPSLTLSLDAADVDIEELKHLLASTDQNCDMFPQRRVHGDIIPVESRKLRRALTHSTVVVSAHVRGLAPGDDYMPAGCSTAQAAQVQALGPDTSSPLQTFQGLWDTWQKKRFGEKRLVAFGRASSDSTLTASIHDLAVAPALQGAGLGALVLQRIVRELCARGILDIAALMPEDRRLFFARHGFRPDITGASTMMYLMTTSPDDDADNGEASKCEWVPCGSKVVVLPPPLEVPFPLRRPLAALDRVVEVTKSRRPLVSRSNRRGHL